jgi:hypothetical protein
MGVVALAPEAVPFQLTAVMGRPPRTRHGAHEDD